MMTEQQKVERIDYRIDADNVESWLYEHDGKRYAEAQYMLAKETPEGHDRLAMRIVVDPCAEKVETRWWNLKTASVQEINEGIATPPVVLKGDDVARDYVVTAVRNSLERLSADLRTDVGGFPS